jgi:hypothetical protein
VWLTRAAKPRGKASYVISDLRQLLTIAGLWDPSLQNGCRAACDWCFRR